MMSVMNTYTQQCHAPITQTQNLDLSNITNSTILARIRAGQAVNFNLQCYQEALADNKLTQELANSAAQSADALAQALSLSRAEASNVASLLTEASVDVRNTFRQECFQPIAQMQTVRIREIAGSYIDVAVDYQQRVQSAINCTLDAVSRTDAIQQVKQTIQQKATAKVEGLLGGLCSCLLIVLVIAGAVILGGARALLNPYVIGLIVLIIIAFFFLAWIMSWWPFSPPDQDEADLEAHKRL